MKFEKIITIKLIKQFFCKHKNYAVAYRICMAETDEVLKEHRYCKDCNKIYDVLLKGN